MKKSLYGVYGTDRRLESEGVWVDFRGVCEIRVRSIKTTQADSIRNEVFRRNRRKLAASEGIPAEVVEETNLALLSQWVVAAWRGVEDADGNTLPCTPENVRRVMSDLRALRDDVLDIAGMDETFKAAPVEALAGNSPSTSGLASSGEAPPPSSPSKPQIED